MIPALMSLTPGSRLGPGDGRAVVVQSGACIPARLERVDPTTGARTPIRELAPPDRTGVNFIAMSEWADDGRRYLYTYSRELSKLFVVTGVKSRLQRLSRLFPGSVNSGGT